MVGFSGTNTARSLAILTLALASVGLFSELRAQHTTAKIVGLGATACARFVEDINADPTLKRDYLAWAQGFMSGILVSRPAGVDEALNLNPVTFDLAAQLQFLEGQCVKDTKLSFSDAVTSLYQRLRNEGRT